MSYDTVTILVFLVLFVLYFFILREEDGTITIGSLFIDFGISVMFASAWPVLLWTVGICIVLSFVVGICKLIDDLVSPTLSSFGQHKIKVF